MIATYFVSSSREEAPTVQALTAKMCEAFDEVTRGVSERVKLDVAASMFYDVGIRTNQISAMQHLMLQTLITWRELQKTGKPPTHMHVVDDADAIFKDKKN